MSANRKTIKITIPADQVWLFEIAKGQAEDAAMMKMSDTQYASRLIQWAIDQKSDRRASVTVLNPEGTDDLILGVSGHAGTKAHETACKILWQGADKDNE